MKASFRGSARSESATDIVSFAECPLQPTVFRKRTGRFRPIAVISEVASDWPLLALSSRRTHDSKTPFYAVRFLVLTPAEIEAWLRIGRLDQVGSHRLKCIGDGSALKFRNWPWWFRDQLVCGIDFERGGQGAFSGLRYAT
jgi:hypothetical protein